MPPDRLPLFCCPDCKGPLRTDPRVLTPSGRIKSGILFCKACNRVAGVIRNFKYDFVHFDGQIDVPTAPPLTLATEVRDEAIRFDDPRLIFTGSWEPWDEKYRMSHGPRGDEVAYTGQFCDVGVRLLKHPWSGIVRFELDGKPVGTADLFQPQWSTVCWFPIAADLAPGEHTIKIIPAGEKNPASAAYQVFFCELIVTRPCRPSDAPPPAQDTNRVLPVFPAVIDLMKQVPAGGLILDCGCGDRILDDPRYIGMDYEQYQLPSVYGDALKLPFKDNTFDLTFSQAVLEHVRDPFQAVAEMCRISRPGGVVWAGMAFLQPVHAVPSHYFNATPWGIEELFRGMDIASVSWFGELSFTVDWLFKASGVAAKVDPAEYAEILDRVKSYDKLVSYDDLKSVASGVAIEAVKKRNS